MHATAHHKMPEQVEKLVQNAESMGSVAEAVGSHEAVLEAKYDGWRTVWEIDDGGKARFYTRKGNELTGAWPAVEALLAEALPPGTILDGEAVVFETHDGLTFPVCRRVQGILGCGTQKAALASGALTLVVFDMLAHGAHDARTLPYAKRRALLESLFEGADFPPMKVMLAPHFDATDASHEQLLDRGYEGSVVKWLDRPYKSGARGHGMFKLKGEKDCDVVVTGYKDGEEGWVGMVGAVEFGQYDADGILVYRGRCSGMDWDLRELLTADRDAYLGKVFTMRHNGVYPPTVEHPLGAFRHPRFKELRPDKGAEAVTIHDE